MKQIQITLAFRWISDMRRKEADKSSAIFWTIGVESVDLKRIVWWQVQFSHDHNLNSVLFSADVTAHFHKGPLNIVYYKTCWIKKNKNKI